MKIYNNILPVSFLELNQLHLYVGGWARKMHSRTHTIPRMQMLSFYDSLHESFKVLSAKTSTQNKYSTYG